MSIATVWGIGVSMGMGVGGLSAQAWSMWAKTGGKEYHHLWEPLPTHMMDAALVARLLWRNWVSEHVRQYICAQTGLDADGSESLVVWLAGVHDIGKATPSFQSKVPERAERVNEAGLSIASRCENSPHAFLSQILLQRWLEKRGWPRPRASGLASVVGGHHGSNPTSSTTLNDIEDLSAAKPLSVLGDEAWAKVQEELLEELFERSGMADYEEALSAHGVKTYAQILLTGLVIMADWIASNASLFPLVSERVTWEDAQRRAEEGWRALDLPQALALEQCALDAEGLFHESFDYLPLDASPRPVQARAVAEAIEMDSPGMIVIEAPMGCGKTEAALMCAEILAQKFKAGGLAYLLPTQATSNAMFTRVKAWLGRMLDRQPMGQRQNLHLLHGKATLNESFSALPKWHSTWMGDGQTGKDGGESVAAHQWFSGKKRGLLSPFIVATVDQLLFAALRTRHAHLRHTGVAGKVVIIDEVHAYDAYMSVYLDRILEYLGEYGVPVILLSATLPPSRREMLLNAYRGSRRSVAQDAPSRKHHSSGSPVAYPLITTMAKGAESAPACTPIENDGRTRCVKIEFYPDDDDALVALAREELQDGGVMCVLRDTVVRAQSAYNLLSSSLDADVRLIHSRFVAADRARREAELTKQLGSDSSVRPRKLILVATQVLEQSVDIDVDLLVSDIAPIDLLLQRIGRLHRHERGREQAERPARLRQARCILTGVEQWEATPPTFSSGVDAVYQPALLWKTIAALENHAEEIGHIRLPDDIAPLVEAVYEGEVHFLQEWEPSVSEAEQRMAKDIERKRGAAKQWLLGKPARFNLNGWMRGRLNVDDEARGSAAVRDTEESIEVVVVQQTEEGLQILPWVAEAMGVDGWLGDGLEVPSDEAARVVATCTVALPPRLCAPWCAGQVIDALESNAILDGWRESGWLAEALPLVVDEKGEATIEWEGHEVVLQYSRETGLSITGERG